MTSRARRLLPSKNRKRRVKIKLNKRTSEKPFAQQRGKKSRGHEKFVKEDIGREDSGKTGKPKRGWRSMDNGKGER